MSRPRLSHTNEDFITLKFLKINEINTFFSLLFLYKSINLISYPLNYFIFSHDIHNRNLRNLLELRPPYCPSLRSQRSPAYYAAINWNRLPTEIKIKPSVSSFKSSLKVHLLQQYDDY